jgi:hypothetical protein
MATILDVLENALDGELTAERAASLAPRELGALSEVLEEYYAAWEPPTPAAGELRAYPGGWVAANYTAPEAKSLLATTLLYFHTILIHDPVGEWFDRRRAILKSPPPVRYRNRAKVQGAQAHLMRFDGYHYTRDEPERTREQLRWMLPMLSDFAPLIRAGIAIPFNQLGILVDRQTGLLTAVRHDVTDDELMRRIREPIDLPPVTADFSRGLHLDLRGAGGPVPGDESKSVVQNPSYYLNKTLAIADAASARYIPPSATDFALYARRLQRTSQELSRRANLDLSVAAGLSRTELPLLEELDLRTLVELRRTEEAFEAWRTQLRTAVRQIESGPETEQFKEEAKEVLEDCLSAVAADVRRAQSRSHLLRASKREMTINLTTGVAVAGGAALLGAGAPAAVAAAGISAIARWTVGALFPPKPSGARAVITALMR